MIEQPRSTFKTSMRGGFTLIEMTVVLIIMSVVVGGGFAIATNYIERQKAKTALSHLDEVEKALLDFRKANNRLPCPADGTLNPDDPNFGIEAENPGTCTGGTPAANFVAAEHITKTGNPATDVTGGVVPVITLGLPAEYAFDGWDNKISYHVDGRATEYSAFSKYTISNSNCFNVIIDDDRTWLDDGDRNYSSFHAAYALISHGKDGHGAFSKGGPRINASTTNTFQIQNAKYDSAGAATTYNNLFHLLPETEDPDAPRAGFDDVVRFKTRAQLRTSQDGPGIIFPDLVVSSHDTTNNIYGTQFYYRCGDEFQQEPKEMVDINNKRVQRVAISPNNTYILGAMQGDYHFRMWTYDGVRTTQLPDSSFLPFPNTPGGTGQTAVWDDDGDYFLVSALDDGDTPNRISVYEKSGVNEFTRVDAAIENSMTSSGFNVLNAGALWGLNVAPDGDHLVIMMAGATEIKPVVQKRNPDNSFSEVPNAIPEMPEISVRRPDWSPDGSYLMFSDWYNNDIYLFRNDGNYHYSLLPDPTPVPTWGTGTAAFSPDSRFLAIGSRNSTDINIYELGANDQYTKISPHPANLNGTTKSLQFSPNGKYLAVGRSRSASLPELYIYKIEGSKFTLLTGSDGPDVSPDGDVQWVEWRHQMPWER